MYSFSVLCGFCVGIQPTFGFCIGRAMYTIFFGIPHIRYHVGLYNYSYIPTAVLTQHGSFAAGITFSNSS